jgi:hypothetical protein
MRWAAGVTAKDDFLEAKGIRRSENRAHILEAAKVRQNGNHGYFGVIFGLFHGWAVQFIHAFEAHAREEI